MGQFVFTSDGKRLFLFGDRTVQVWDVDQGRKIGERHRLAAEAEPESETERRVVRSHPNIHFRAAVSPQGKWIAGSNLSSSITLTEVNGVGRRIVFKAENASPILFSPDEKLLIWTVGSCSDGVVHLVEVATGKELSVLRSDQREWIGSFAFSADSKNLATGGADTTVLIWDLSKFKYK